MFFARRFVRVAPPYYAATLALMAVALAAPQLLTSTRVDPAHVIASFLFVPWDHPVSHNPFPVLHVGWTLNAEMQFYAVFAVAIAVCATPVLRSAMAIVTLVALVILGELTQTDNQTLSSWMTPALIEFTYGIVIGRLWHGMGSNRVRPPTALGWLFVLVGAGFIFLPNMASYDLWSLSVGVPAALLVFGCLIIERNVGMPRSAALLFMGDASYSIYLWHMFGVGAVRAVWPATGVGTVWGEVSFVIVACFVALAGSCVAYVIVDRPLVAWAKQRLVQHRAPTVRA